MSVDRSDEVYGESLIEHAGAELSGNVAAGLRREAHLQFTPCSSRRSRQRSTTLSADARRSALFGGERESRPRNREGLLATLDELDGPHIPAGGRVDFTEALDGLANQRRGTFAGRPASTRTHGHDRCNYLYANCDWTYPVLTAVTRLRGTVNGVVS